MQQDFVGLSSGEAKDLLRQNGLNKLPEKPPPSWISILLAQLKSPLVYILLVAGVITTVLGHNTDTIIIAVAVVINTALGFIQERRANESLRALQNMVHPTTLVVRDGKQIEVNAEEIVVGDICVLNQGSKVPADGEMVSVSRLYVTEAMLTGESNPVEKQVSDKAYMGTVISAGRGYMKVTDTGEKTKMGGIALTVQEPYDETPLKKQLSDFSKQLTVLVIILTTGVFVVGYLLNRDSVELFKTSVALAVSAIPEGLLVGLTVVLAIGMQRILKKKGLVRNLVSAETLGGVTTICVDKTGTLTEGQMRVDGFGGDLELLARQSVVANDLDDPVVLAAYEWAKKQADETKLLKKFERLDSMPFSSKSRYFASLHKYSSKKNIVFVNGAPEYLLKWADLTEKQRKQIKVEIDTQSAQGKRLVAMAYKEVSTKIKNIDEENVENNLKWAGILYLSDPVRKGIKEAFQKTAQAGIKSMVITGDYPKTARYVMREIGIDPTDTSIIEGKELRKMSDSDLDSLLKDFEKVLLFARTTPDQKLKIVDSLKRNGEVVAMMGDGVNDAPALNKADIGIVVENATDVAKESADLVLLDSNFYTIVDAVEEGRGIYDNLRKIILYLMSDAFSEIIAVVGSIALSLPLPVTAAQILWINLASDGFPHLALTFDPKDPESMRRQPRDTQEKIVTGWMKKVIAIISIFSGVSTLIVFILIRNATGDDVLARSVSFLLLGVNSLFYVFSVRTLTEPIWKSSPFNNKWLLVAVLSGALLQAFPFVTGVGRDFFEVVLPPLQYWWIVLGVSCTIIVLIEFTKHSLKRHLK